MPTADHETSRGTPTTAVEGIPWQPLLDTPYALTASYPVDPAASSAPTQFVTLAWLLNSEPFDARTSLALVEHAQNPNPNPNSP